VTLTRLSLLLASTALVMVARSPAASAASWLGTASTDWFDPANWSPPAVPDATTNVVIDQGTPNANPTIGINATSNAAASAAVEIGDLSGTTGIVTLSTTNAHPASWNITGVLQVGESGTGTINVSNAATLTNTTGQTLIGSNSTGVGTVTVDGVGTLWNEQATASSVGSAPIVVGNSGTGTLTISNGATVETTGNLGHFVIGFDTGSHGTVTVGSAGAPNLANVSTLTNNFGLNGPGSLFVGYMGTGTLTINSDGVVNGFDGGAIGAQAGGHGTVTVNGGSLDVTAGNAATADSLTVGGFGLGTMTVQNGGTATSASASIADQAGSAGSSVTVTGTGSTWNIVGGSTGLTVGNSDTGSLSVLAGGAVIITGGVEVNIGGFTGINGTGTVLVDNATLTANGSFIQTGVLGNPGSTLPS
jgi:T5SS/PEP-CTERM-associated repeat protein